MSEDRIDEMLARYANYVTDDPSAAPQRSNMEDENERWGTVEKPQDQDAAQGFDRPTTVATIKSLALPALLCIGVVWGLIVYMF